MTHASRLPLILLAVVVAAALTACGIDGTALPGEIDVRTLDVGTYPVDRHNYDQDSRGNGALLEGMRMSEAVPAGVRIDATLDVGRGGAVTIDPQDAEDGFLAVGSGPVLRRHEMVIGYGAGSSDAPDPRGQEYPSDTTTAVTNLVMRFPSESAAKLAARELEDVDYAFAPDQNRRLNLTEYPDAYIHWRPNVANIGTFLAYKQFVISLLVQRPRADSDDLLEWVRKTLDATVAALDKFDATPTDKLDGLKVDPDHLLARVATAHRGSRTPDPNTFAVYGPTSFVHNIIDQTLGQRLLTDAGVDHLAVVDNTNLMRARDARAATDLLAGITNNLGDAYDPIMAPKEIPSAKCFQGNSPDDSTVAPFRCYVAYKRYVAMADSDSETDARQRIAAQYALLANSL